MNPGEQNSSSTRSPGVVAAIFYYLINILLFPITLIGYVVMSAEFYGKRNSAVSGTALSPLTGRWLLHNMGTRLDEPANRLLMAMSGLSVSLTLGPMILAHRLTGFVPKEYLYPFRGEITLGNQGFARQTFYDRAVEQHLPKITQFVILGAGFDTRALRLKNLANFAHVRSFEIDTPPTQAFKREKLAQAGIDAGGVTFVPANFETDDWLVKLTEAGFDPGRPALFIWEGVTPYLNEAAVKATLGKIAGLAKDTSVAFDHFSSEMLESPSLTMRSIRASLSAGGEPLKFGVDSTPPLRNGVTALVQACGLALVEQHTMGPESAAGIQPGKRAWGGFVVAAVK